MTTKLPIYYYSFSELLEKLKPLNIIKDDIFKLMDSCKLSFEVMSITGNKNAIWFPVKEVDMFIDYHTDNFLYKHLYPYPETINGHYTLYGAGKRLNINPGHIRGLIKHGMLKKAFVSKKIRSKLPYRESVFTYIKTDSIEKYEKFLRGQMLEKNLEAKIVKIAKNLDILCYKFISPSNRGVPDRIFICRCNIFFIEFKSDKGELTAQQEHTIDKFRKKRVVVHVVNNIEDGLKILEKHKECWRL